MLRIQSLHDISWSFRPFIHAKLLIHYRTSAPMNLLIVISYWLPLSIQEHCHNNHGHLPIRQCRRIRGWRLFSSQGQQQSTKKGTFGVVSFLNQELNQLLNRERKHRTISYRVFQCETFVHLCGRFAASVIFKEVLPLFFIAMDSIRFNDS